MAEPTVTPTASAEKFDMPPYVVMLAIVLPWAAGTVWMLLRSDMSLSDALLGGLVVVVAVDMALLVMALLLVWVVLPVAMGMAIVVLWPLTVAGVLLHAVATGFMSGLRSAAAGRRPVDPAQE